MHTVEIIDFKKLDRGFHAVLGRCCGDPVHSSWHTMGPIVLADESKLAASVQTFVDRVASQHEAALQAESILKSLVGTSTQVEVIGGVATVVPDAVPPATAQTATIQ